MEILFILVTSVITVETLSIKQRTSDYPDPLFDAGRHGAGLRRILLLEELGRLSGLRRRARPCGLLRLRLPGDEDGAERQAGQGDEDHRSAGNSPRALGRRQGAGDRSRLRPDLPLARQADVGWGLRPADRGRAGGRGVLSHRRLYQ